MRTKYAKPETFRAQIKPLVWKRFRKGGFRSTAKVVNSENQWTSRYHVGDSLSGRTTDWFYWFDGKGEKRVKTKQAAIDACNRHNRARVKALLIIENRAR